MVLVSSILIGAALGTRYKALCLVPLTPAGRAVARCRIADRIPRRVRRAIGILEEARTQLQRTGALVRSAGPDFLTPSFTARS